MKPEDKYLMESHNYDGIQELDNPLPKWWQFIFYATIIFAAGYYYYYELGSGPSSDMELSQDLEKMKSAKQAANVQAADAQPEEGAPSVDLAALIADPEALKAGATEYEAKCAICHGKEGQGTVGPNLTDSSWVTGDGSVESIHKIIRDGVPNTGMRAWKGMIGDELLAKLAAYVKSIQGSNPTNPKAPEGTAY